MPSSSAHWAVGQHDVGELGGLGQEDVGDHQQVQGAPAGRGPGSTSGAETAMLRGQHQQGPDAAVGAQPVEHLERRQARLRQLVRVDAPDRRPRARGAAGSASLR